MQKPWQTQGYKCTTKNLACQAYMQYLSLSLRLTVQFNKHRTGTKIMDAECECTYKIGDIANKSK